MSIRKQMKVTSAALALLATGLFANTASAQQVFVTDVIIQGSLCVGIDCVNGMSFGFDTVVLQENNLRMFFNDTSSSASFPQNDWRLIANDSSNGGANYFAIEDATAGRVPFRVEAGAPVNTLHVDAAGRIGIKTANPVVDLHIVEGNTPTMRLEQDGSDGFTPQTWDVAGNEANFFIRDVTGGSDLVFKIKPGAPTSSIFIAANGDIGLGTEDPDSDLHIRDTAGAAALTLEGDMGEWQIVSRSSDGEMAFNDVATTGPDFVFKTADSDANTAWEFVHRADNGLGFNISTSVGGDMILSNAGNLTVLGTVTSGGPTCGGGCDEVFDPAYDLPSIEEHAALMFANKHLPAVGPTSPETPVNLTEYVGNMLNELEKAHIYIDELNKRNLAMEERLRKLEQQQR